MLIIKNITIFNGSIPQIGYIARTGTKGDEMDMVNYYIQYIIKQCRRYKKKKLAVFIEPQIETGYPDIVIVEYCEIPAYRWNKNRKQLSNTDLKILFEIEKAKEITISQLGNLLGYCESEIEKSISRLHNASLIKLIGRKICRVPKSQYCCVKKVIAIEAKIDKWSEAIRQANNNIWFSTESRILLNKEKCTPVIIDKCIEQGIGVVLVNGKVKKSIDGEIRKFPVSYLSLLFNEWVQRYLHMEE